ncbi:hypothetical protein HELRODRAFT_164018 [Helobdella robusta]|uniref:Endonuclease/exonuclease/phosphatase domain-containing protein n=1 Tax=Helobdella robusta TaxID=6412 RepID=T1EUS0_HELRO|nr:hypothetical protein HELRODRAFT_164018 [Helobdella robusta]ESN94219.1 hypothetical protein HELRODRAFT_164018 [Helobdella robusta]
MANKDKSLCCECNKEGYNKLLETIKGMNVSIKNTETNSGSIKLMEKKGKGIAWKYEVSKDRKKGKKFRHKLGNEDNCFDKVRLSNGNKDRDCKLGVLYSHVDSICNKMGKIRYLVDSIYKKMLILIFVDTNPKNLTGSYRLQEFQIKGFRLYSCNFMKAGFIGIFCHVKNTLSSVIVDFESKFEEYIAVRLLNLKEEISFLYRSPYRSPNSCLKNNDELLNLIKIFIGNGGNKFIIGDFNIPTINWESMSVSGGLKSFQWKFIDCVNYCFLVQFIDAPTRYKNRQKQNILDLLLAQQQNLIQDIKYNSPVGKSDHLMLSFSLVVNTEVITHLKENKMFDYKKGNYFLMNQFISANLSMPKIDNSIKGDGDKQIVLDEIWDKFVMVINMAVNKYVPLKTEIFTKNNHSIELPTHLLELIKEKKLIWKRYMKNRKSMLYEDFKRIRNEESC